MSFHCTLLFFPLQKQPPQHKAKPLPLLKRWPHIQIRLKMPIIQNSNMITCPSSTRNQAWLCWLKD
jgi:hypothetical protein